jgi:hypothetical protein
MSTAASFHADLGARLHVLLDFLNPAITLQPLVPNRALSAIHPVHLKDVFRKINPNASKLHFDLSPFVDWNPDNSSLALDAVEWGGVHPIASEELTPCGQPPGFGR